MATLLLETSLLVDSYMEDPDTGERFTHNTAAEDAFDCCSEDDDAARESALNDVAIALNVVLLDSRIVAGTVTFVEFDSSNVNHACGYFSVKISGLTDEEVAQVKKWIEE